jgi:serine/threonine protein phosphatase PrpC
MRFTVNHDSRIGKRGSNQDRVGWAHTDDALLLVVCDGMGGHRHGEVAAQIVLDNLLASFRISAQPRVDDPPRFLRQGFTDAHWAINNYASLRAIPLNDAPRTTCVACLVQDGIALFAHTGDSRGYLVRAGRTTMRTLDHSRVQMLIDAGEITELEAQTHPQRNLVVTCLGGDVLPHIDIAPPQRLETGDTLALCSDGVWSPLGESLAAGLSYPLERAIPSLLERAEQMAGSTCDNLSLLALRWEDVAGRPQSDERTLAATFVHTLVEDFTRTLPRPMSEAEIADAVAAVRDRITTNSQSFKPATQD